MGSHIGQAPWRKAAAPVLLATHLAACTSWRVENVPPAQLLQTKAPSEVRVTRPDDSKVVLTRPGIVRDSLWGWSRGAQLGIPLTDVTVIATRHGDTGKTVALGLGIVVVTVAAAGIYCAATDCFKFNLNLSGR
jgi:hypothetical protein